MSPFSLRWRPQVTVIDLANNSGHVPVDVSIRVTRLDMRDHTTYPPPFLASPVFHTWPGWRLDLKGSNTFAVSHGVRPRRGYGCRSSHRSTIIVDHPESGEEGGGGNDDDDDDDDRGRWTSFLCWFRIVGRPTWSFEGGDRQRKFVSWLGEYWVRIVSSWKGLFGDVYVRCWDEETNFFVKNVTDLQYLSFLILFTRDGNWRSGYLMPSKWYYVFWKWICH